MSKIILDLCGGTGAWSKPYKDAGYDVRVITLPDYDVTEYVPPDNVHGVLAAPPCTEFSTAKRWTISRDIDGAMKIVRACLDIIRKVGPAFWALENPRGMLRKHLGQPRYSFQPWHFGDPWTKRTCLWGEFREPVRTVGARNELVLIPELYIKPRGGLPELTAQHNKAHKKYIKAWDCFEALTDAGFRAITPPGFAKAFYEANK